MNACVTTEQQPQETQNTTIITPQQLAMLLQQQQGNVTSSSLNSVVHQQQARPASVPSGLPFPILNVNSSSIGQTYSGNSNTGSIQTSSGFSSPTCVVSSSSGSNNGQHSGLRFIAIPSSNVPTSTTTGGNIAPRVVHLQAKSGSPAPGNSSTSNTNFPVRAQFLTSNGETLTIHRASTASSAPSLIRVSRPPQQPQLVKRLPPGNFISMDPSKQQQFCLTTDSKTVTIKLPKDGLWNSNSSTPSLRLISSSPSTSNATIEPSNNNPGIIHSASGLADFITSQLAASNIGPISPLTQNSEQSQTENQQPMVVVFSKSNENSNSGEGTRVNNSSSSSSTSSYGSNPMADLINSTNEAILDLQDTISESSPYSLISELEPPNIAEIVDVTSNDSSCLASSNSGWMNSAQMQQTLSEPGDSNIETKKDPMVSGMSRTVPQSLKITANSGSPIQLPIGYNPLLAQQQKGNTSGGANSINSNNNVSSSWITSSSSKIGSSVFSSNSAIAAATANNLRILASGLGSSPGVSGGSNASPPVLLTNTMLRQPTNVQQGTVNPTTHSVMIQVSFKDVL